jgi:hypothetical protein
MVLGGEAKRREAIQQEMSTAPYTELPKITNKYIFSLKMANTIFIETLTNS